MKQSSSPRRPARTVAAALFLIALIAGTIFILRRHQSESLLTAEGRIFGTVYRVSYVHTAALDADIRRVLLEVDSSLSMFNPTSTVSLINSNQSSATDPLLRHVYGVARGVSVATGGAYDVTVAPLVDAWGFGVKGPNQQPPANVDSIMAFVGYDKVSLDGQQLVKSDPRVRLDFSSVAKGYGVDLVAHLLDSVGCRSYLVEIGGEVVVKGLHPEGRPWVVGIERPSTDGTQGVFQRLSITGTALATSGNYLRYYERDGRRYAHTIDPHTGHPVEHNLLSATVLAPDCATADAYATAFMVLGMDEARKVLAKHKELEAYLIYEDEKGNFCEWHTPGLGKYLKP